MAIAITAPENFGRQPHGSEFAMQSMLTPVDQNRNAWQVETP
jgi:hypothetical protein